MYNDKIFQLAYTNKFHIKDLIKKKNNKHNL